MGETPAQQTEPSHDGQKVQAGETIRDVERTVTLWAADGLTVVAELGADDQLVISGQDLKSGAAYGSEINEHEYGYTIAAADVGRVLKALQAPAGADVLDVLERDGSQLVRTGESIWLARNGIEAEFWSRSG